MAKLNREGRLREKRVDKEARKAARKLSAANDAEAPPQLEDFAEDPSGLEHEPVDAGAGVGDPS